MKKSSCNLMWELLNPAPEYSSRWDAFRDYWHRQTLARQRQLFYYLREAKKKGVAINPNPLFAIQDCHPVPTNWNGREGINKMMKQERMVIAKYGSTYGSYTLFEAWLFEMSEATAANFWPDTLNGKPALMFNAIRRKEK